MKFLYCCIYHINLDHHQMQAFNSYNKSLLDEFGIYYHGPRKLEPDQGSVRDVWQNKQKEFQCNDEERSKRTWYLMPKHDGIFMAFHNGLFLSKRGNYELLSKRKLKNSPTEKGGTHFFRLNDSYHEATARIYFNRLSNLVWHEYLEEYQKFGKQHPTALPNQEIPQEKCCMNNIFDLNTWANAKSPVTLMSEVICVKRNEDQAQVRRREKVSALLSEQVSEEDKAGLWVSKLHDYQDNERYESFYRLMKEANSRRTMNRIFSAEVWNGYYRNMEAKWNHFKRIGNISDDQFKNLRVNEIRKAKSNIYSEYRGNHLDAYEDKWMLFDFMPDKRFQNNILPFARRMRILSKCVHSLNAMLDVGIKNGNINFSNLPINAEVVDVISVEKYDMFERIAKAAFEKNQEGLIMMASPPDSIVDAQKTVGNEDKQVEVSFKLKKIYDIPAIIQAETVNKEYQLFHQLNDGHVSKKEVSFDFNNTQFKSFYKFQTEKLGNSKQWVAEPWLFIGPWAAKVSKVEDITRSKTIKRKIKLPACAKVLQTIETQWRHHGKPKYMSGVSLRVTTWNSRALNENCENKVSKSPILIRDMWFVPYTESEQSQLHKENLRLQHKPKNDPNNMDYITNATPVNKLEAERITEILERFVEQNDADYIITEDFEATQDEIFWSGVTETWKDKAERHYVKMQNIWGKKDNYLKNYLRNDQDKLKELKEYQYPKIYEGDDQIFQAREWDLYVKAKTEFELFYNAWKKCNDDPDIKQYVYHGKSTTSTEPKPEQKDEQEASKKAEDEKREEKEYEEQEESGEQEYNWGKDMDMDAECVSQQNVDAVSSKDVDKGKDPAVPVDDGKDPVVPAHKGAQRSDGNRNSSHEHGQSSGQNSKKARPTTHKNADIKYLRDAIHFVRNYLNPKPEPQDVLSLMNQEFKRNELNEQMKKLRDQKSFDLLKPLREKLTDFDNEMKKEDDTREWAQYLRGRYRYSLVHAQLSKDQVRNLTEEELKNPRTMDLDECMHALTLEVNPYFLYFDSPPSNSP